MSPSLDLGFKCPLYMKYNWHTFKCLHKNEQKGLEQQCKQNIQLTAN